MPAVPKEEPKKVEEVKPPVQEPKEAPKAEATSSTVDSDDIYATINGFYEMMMDLTPEQRKELRAKAQARWEAEKKQMEAPAVEMKTEVPTEVEKVTGEVTQSVETPVAVSSDGTLSLFPDTDFICIRPENGYNKGRKI